MRALPVSTIKPVLDQFGQPTYPCPVCGNSFLVVRAKELAPYGAIERALRFHMRYTHRRRWILHLIGARRAA